MASSEIVKAFHLEYDGKLTIKWEGKNTPIKKFIRLFIF